MTDHELRLKSIQYRRELLEAIFRAGAGHTGGSLSCVDILNVLYNRVLKVSPETFDKPDRDRYIQSKGHSVEALYVVLADRGFFPKGLTQEEYYARTHIHYGSPDEVIASLQADVVLPHTTELICQVHPGHPTPQQMLTALERTAKEVAPALGWSPHPGVTVGGARR